MISFSGCCPIGTTAVFLSGIPLTSFPTPAPGPVYALDWMLSCSALHLPPPCGKMRAVGRGVKGLENYKTCRDAIIREILLYVCEHRDLPKDCHNQDKAKIVKECADTGYLEGIKTIKTMDGCIHFTVTQPFVTQKGLTFLYPESAQRSDIDPVVLELKRMNDDMRQDHAEEQSEKKKDRRFQLLNTLFGALIGAFFTLLIEHLDRVLAFFSRLFQ